MRFIIAMAPFIVHQKSNYLFSIELKPDKKNVILLKSLIASKILGAGTTINSDFTRINLNAMGVFSLPDLLLKYKRERNLGKLNYRETESLVRSLSRQIECLENSGVTGGWTFYNFSLDSILVVCKNGGFSFVCLDVGYLIQLSSSGEVITFNQMIDLREKFLSPEIRQLKFLPSSASSKCINYSLGCLGLFCILPDFDVDDVEGERKRKMRQIEFTPLYWLFIYLLER
jgi:hypothetical protein